MYLPAALCVADRPHAEAVIREQPRSRKALLAACHAGNDNERALAPWIDRVRAAGAQI